MHCPDGVHISPLGQVPHDPPHPSPPHDLPVHCGMHGGGMHCPAAVHMSPLGQVPHVPPQPSEPQVLPVHCGVQVIIGVTYCAMKEA